jgi:NAD(P)-dependent dehydrogenase (short-subunit alcohol dehydrogenase family)
MNRTAQSVVLVTGASSGIGRACALELARRGALVYAASRRPSDEVAAELRSELAPGSRLEVVRLDIDLAQSVGEAVARITAAGRLDAVVHCAGFGIGGALEDASDEEAKAIFETNLFGALRVCRESLPTLRAQGAGTIVLVSSIGGRIALPFQGLYSATKFALEGLAESLSLEVRGQGVRVVLIEPGDFRTGFTDRRARLRSAGDGSAYRDAFARALAVIESDERSASSPEPVARLVCRILDARRPRLRYTVGPFAQRLAVHLKKAIPGRAFESIIASTYRLGAGAARADRGRAQ